MLKTLARVPQMRVRERYITYEGTRHSEGEALGSVTGRWGFGKWQVVEGEKARGVGGLSGDE